MNKPNIIFIFSDQQRHDSCGCYGQKLDITPNLDKMAEEGVLFTNAFTCQPLCTPARACIQTGLYPTQTGVFRNNVGLPISDKNIANYLSRNGYDKAFCQTKLIFQVGLVLLGLIPTVKCSNQDAVPYALSRQINAAAESL